MPRIANELARISDTYTAPPPRPHTRKRRSAFGHIVDRLTLVGQVMTKTEFANALLLAVVELLYDVDADGEFANFDIDGRVLVPLPWGSAGYAEWNVRVTEARCLRYIMAQRGTKPGAWIEYRPATRSWHVTQRTRRHPEALLKAAPITNDEWRQAWAVTRTAWNVARAQG